MLDDNGAGGVVGADQQPCPGGYRASRQGIQIVAGIVGCRINGMRRPGYCNRTPRRDSQLALSNCQRPALCVVFVGVGVDDLAKRSGGICDIRFRKRLDRIGKLVLVLRPGDLVGSRLLTCVRGRTCVVAGYCRGCVWVCRDNYLLVPAGTPLQIRHIRCGCLRSRRT